MKVKVLGTKYKIIKKKYDEYPRFKENSIDGECDSFKREIVVCDMRTYPGFEDAEDDEIKKNRK